MSNRPFRQHHVLEILQAFDPDRGPLDGFVHAYYRQHKALGSKDRREISQQVYDLVRWQGLLDAIGEGAPSWADRLDLALSLDIQEEGDKRDLADHDRVSFPKNLFDLIAKSHGEEKAVSICLASNTQAPPTIRANSAKIPRDKLLARLAKTAEVAPTPISAVGIQFRQRLAFFSLPEFQEGLFEVQDEGSQLLAQLVEATPGDHVLDYCAGAGGKSLAIAPQLDGKGQLYLFDIREHALQEAKKRLRRAGAQNVQFLERSRLKRLKTRMDWVLVDAPCSGTGTLRRNPDMKWRFSQDHLDELVRLQREIVTEAIRYLKPNGTLVYATCSLLDEENQEQVAFFEKELGLVAVGEPFVSLPTEGGMDGFFGQQLRLQINPHS